MSNLKVTAAISRSLEQLDSLQVLYGRPLTHLPGRSLLLGNHLETGVSDRLRYTTQGL